MIFAFIVLVCLVEARQAKKIKRKEKKMRSEKFKKRLNLNKNTIANLSNLELNSVKGGVEDFSQASPTDCESCDTGGGGGGGGSGIGSGVLCFSASCPTASWPPC
jgi:hypothetical protein